MKNNIGKLLEERGMEVKDLAKVTGRTEKHLYKVMHDLSEPGIPLVIDILNYFDKDFDEVFIREEKEAW